MTSCCTIGLESGSNIQPECDKMDKSVTEPAMKNLLLFKSHGSLLWRREGDTISDYGLSLERGPGTFAVIYPTQAKEYPYEEPFKTAYRYLEDYLKYAKVAIAIGYSF